MDPFYFFTYGIKSFQFWSQILMLSGHVQGQNKNSVVPLISRILGALKLDSDK
jgi:hypothetical protein